MALRLTAGTVRLNRSGLQILMTDRLGGVGRDLQARAMRVTTRMRANSVAGHAAGSPERRSGTLYSSIAFIRFAVDGQGLHADIGPQVGRTVKRGYNYALVLEGVIPRGGAPPPGTYPFMAKSLEAARY